MKINSAIDFSITRHDICLASFSIVTLAVIQVSKKAKIFADLSKNCEIWFS